MLGGPSRPQTAHNSSRPQWQGIFLWRISAWPVGRRSFHKPIGTRSRFAHHPPHHAQRSADSSRHELNPYGVSCSKSLVTIFRRYVFQIRSRFPWRLAMFGPSSCFRRRYWTNWISSSSCRCLSMNARTLGVAMRWQRSISASYSRSSGSIRWYMSQAACSIGVREEICDNYVLGVRR